MLLYFCMRATPRSAQSLTTFISRTYFAAAWQSGRLSHSCGSDFRNSDGRCNISKNRREDEVTKLAIDLSPTSDISRLIHLTGFSEPTTSSALTMSLFSDKHVSGSKNASEIIISLRYHRCLEKAVVAVLDIDLSS